MNTFKTLAVSAVVAAAAATASHAATLTGDEVTLTIADIGFSESTTVGAGVDFVVGSVSWDLDAGADGNELIVDTDGTFAGFGATSFELTGLDFSGGEILVGFSDIFSQMADTVVTFTADSLLVTFIDGPVDDGVTFSGVFDTRPTAVPLPAGLPMIASGLALLGFLGRRRKA